MWYILWRCNVFVWDAKWLSWFFPWSACHEYDNQHEPIWLLVFILLGMRVRKTCNALVVIADGMVVEIMHPWTSTQSRIRMSSTPKFVEEKLRQKSSTTTVESDAMTEFSCWKLLPWQPKTFPCQRNGNCWQDMILGKTIVDNLDFSDGRGILYYYIMICICDANPFCTLFNAWLTLLNRMTHHTNIKWLVFIQA